MSQLIPVETDAWAGSGTPAERDADNSPAASTLMHGTRIRSPLAVLLSRATQPSSRLIALTVGPMVWFRPHQRNCTSLGILSRVVKILCKRTHERSDRCALAASIFPGFVPLKLFAFSADKDRGAQ